MRSPRGRPWPWYLRATEITRRRLALIMRSLAARSPFSMRLASSISSSAVRRGWRRASLKKSCSESSSSTGSVWRDSGVSAGRISVSVVIGNSGFDSSKSVENYTQTQHKRYPRPGWALWKGFPVRRLAETYRGVVLIVCTNNYSAEGSGMFGGAGPLGCRRGASPRRREVLPADKRTCSSEGYARGGPNGYTQWARPKPRQRRTLGVPASLDTFSAKEGRACR
jgi:hypothetical protein